LAFWEVVRTPSCIGGSRYQILKQKNYVHHLWWLLFRRLIKYANRNTSWRLESKSSLILLMQYRETEEKSMRIMLVKIVIMYVYMVGGERERNFVQLLRIPLDSDNSIINCQVTKNLILVTMHFCFSLLSSGDTFLGHRDEEKNVWSCMCDVEVSG